MCSASSARFLRIAIQRDAQIAAHDAAGKLNALDEADAADAAGNCTLGCVGNTDTCQTLNG